ncbi:MAG TPA: choice-of-anchor A family protein [Galbitalea sp.]|jgi:hypothetical protein
MNDGELPARLPLWMPAFIVIVSLATVVAIWTYQSPTPASTQAATCPPSGASSALATGPPLFTDNNIATYVGGNFASSSANLQSEGLVVIMGNAGFSGVRTSDVQVGSVSVGSQVAPSSDTNMLAVGGSVTSGSTIRTHGAEVRQGLGSSATASYNGFALDLRAKSAALAEQATNGSVQASDGELFLTGGGSSRPQIFAIDALALSSGRLQGHSG